MLYLALHADDGTVTSHQIASHQGIPEPYLRLPDEIPNDRFATLSAPSLARMLIGFRPVRLLVEGLNPRSKLSRALSVNPGTSVYLDASRVYARNLEVPAGGGVGTARAMAHAYGVFAAGGRALGLRPDTLDLLAAQELPAAPGPDRHRHRPANTGRRAQAR